MKAVLYIVPISSGAAALSAPGFTPTLTPSGAAFALEVFRRKIDAAIRMRDICQQHGIAYQANAKAITTPEFRMELYTGSKAEKLISLHEWLRTLRSAAHPEEHPLNTKPFNGETALP